jgi:hypothetical protein
MNTRGILQALCLVLVSVWLSACDEGSGKSGNGDGQGLAVASGGLAALKPTLTVSTESLSFQSHEGGAAPVAQLFTGQVSEGSTKPPYIDVEWTGNGLSSVMYDLNGDSITVSVTPKDPATVGVGTFTDQVIINACADSWCKRHLDGSPKTVSVTYTVRNRLGVHPAALAFAYVRGSSPLPSSKTLSLQGTSVHWTAVADMSWIQLSAGSGTTPGSLAVGLEPSGLEAGHHQGSITLNNNDTGESVVVPVTVQVAAPTLSASPSALAFSGLEGRYLPAQPLSLSLDTGSSAYEWTATVDTEGGSQWLFLSSTSGVVSSSPTALAVSVNTAGLPGGTYSGSLTFTTTVAGQTLSRSVPVSLSLATPLWVPDNGVALVSTPSVSKLSHTVTVKDRWGTSRTAWTASSDQPWLSVTPSGISGDNLTVVARPAGLEPNTVHHAQVIVSFGGDSARGNEIIRVGLWVGDGSPNNLDTVAGTYQAIETDPVRPYVYVHNGGGTLYVYNIYTASLVTSITGVATTLGGMTISSDGSTLYVLDTVLPRRIIPVNLASLTPGMSWSLNESTSTNSTTQLAYARPNGQGAVLTNSSKIFEAATGAPFRNVTGTFNNSPTGGIAASLDGSLICSLWNGYYSPYSLYCYGLRYTELNGGSLTLTARPSSPYGVGYNSVDLAINHDGSRVYVAAGSPSSFVVHDGQTMNTLPSLVADTSPNAVEVGPDNRLYGTANTRYGAKDLWAYDNTGTALGSYRLAGYAKIVLERQLKLSGDGKRLVVLTDEPSLKFATGL